MERSKGGRAVGTGGKSGISPAIAPRPADEDGKIAFTHWLLRWNRGDPFALEELAMRVRRERYVLVRGYLRRRRPNQTLQPTALINEVWLRLMGQSPVIPWESRAHFFGIAARLMRIILVDHARSRRALKRGGGLEALSLEQANALSPVVELRYFGGMDRNEIAVALNLTVATVKRDPRLGEAWLRRFLASESPA
jgi:hypothetical protein